MLRFIAAPLYLYVGCMINEITYYQYHLIEFVKAFPDPLNPIRCPVNRRSLPNPLSPVNRPLRRQPLFEAVDAVQHHPRRRWPSPTLVRQCQEALESLYGFDGARRCLITASSNVLLSPRPRKHSKLPNPEPKRQPKLSKRRMPSGRNKSAKQRSAEQRSAEQRSSDTRKRRKR